MYFFNIKSLVLIKMMSFITLFFKIFYLLLPQFLYDIYLQSYVIVGPNRRVNFLFACIISFVVKSSLTCNSLFLVAKISLSFVRYGKLTGSNVGNLWKVRFRVPSLSLGSPRSTHLFDWTQLLCLLESQVLLFPSIGALSSSHRCVSCFGSLDVVPESL